MNGWVMFCFRVAAVFVAVVGAYLLYVIFAVLVYHIGNSIPFMCEQCGHTFTDDEDPSKRCPVCNSD